MNKFVCLLMSAAFASSVTACASAPAPAETGNADAQRSRAEKAQNELGTDVSKPKTENEKR